MSQEKDRLPPHDSWIAIAPGESLELDERSLQLWHEKTRIGRQLRGEILAGCFEIEFSLDLLIGRVLFPDEGLPDNSQSANELRGIFDELFLKGANFTFNRKIEVLRQLRRRIDLVALVVSNESLNKLDKLRGIRNRFAHYPISFRQVQTEHGADFLATLVCSDRSLTLDAPFISELNELLSATKLAMQSANKQVVESQNGPSAQSST